MTCAACGYPTYGTAPHHIKSRGAGGTTDANNMLQLCYDCHIRIHQIGESKFVQLWPQLYNRIAAIKDATKWLKI